MADRDVVVSSWYRDVVLSFRRECIPVTGDGDGGPYLPSWYDSSSKSKKVMPRVGGKRPKLQTNNANDHNDEIISSLSIVPTDQSL